MRKKKISKKKAQEKKQGRKVEPEKELQNEKPFDYGGIPERDLKKNLGCG